MNPSTEAAFELMNIWISLSNKVDTYWTVYIIITASVLAIPLPKHRWHSFFISALITLIYGIYSFISSEALDIAYAALRATQLEIMNHSGQQVISSNYFQSINNLMTEVSGAWHRYVHIGFFALVATYKLIKCWLASQDAY